MEMEALTITCKHLNLEHDSAVAKLRKQKHAAHQVAHRLKRKLRQLELTNRLLLVTYLAGSAHTRILQEQIERRTEAELHDYPEV